MTITTVAPLAAATITAGAQLAAGKAPRLRLVFAGIAGAVALSVLAGIAGGAARALAYLILIGTMLGPGYDLIRALSRLIG